MNLQLSFTKCKKPKWKQTLDVNVVSLLMRVEHLKKKKNCFIVFPLEINSGK